MKTFIKVVSLFLIVGLMASMFVGCTTESEPSGNEGASNGGEKKDGEIVIGLSMDTLKEERWQRDRDIFVAKAEEMGAKVLVQAANGNDNKQVEQAENLLAQGVDVLVVVPHNGEISATIVESAHAEGVPVLSYDRLIKNSEVDYYISFDNEKVGRLQAEYILSKVNKGNFVYIGGAPTDNNALLFRKGAIDVLQPYVDKGDIKIVYDQYSKEWQPSEAQKHMENALTANKDNVDAVICANDGTGGGAIAALAEQQLAGKIPVTGQDAELAATQRIVEGLQSMTVYKPIEKIATKAAEVAIKIAKKEEVEVNNKVNNGEIDVPSILLEPIKVDKDNMMDTIVKDGFHKFEDVYRNVPEDQRPQQ